MDGENNGKPYFQMDDLGGFPYIFGNTPLAPYRREMHHLQLCLILGFLSKALDVNLVGSE